MFFTYTNFLNGLASGLIVAFILEKVGSDSPWVAYNSSFAGTGVVLGGIAVTVVATKLKSPWWTMSIGILIATFIGRIGVSFATLPVAIGLAFLIRNMTMPFMNSCNDSIWQKDVALQDQGRMFGVRRLIAQGLYPLGLFLGPLIAGKIGLQWLFVGVGALECLAPLIFLPHLYSMRSSQKETTDCVASL